MVKLNLLDFARDTMRRKHLSYRTEQAYIYWIRKLILFQGKVILVRWVKRRQENP
jgi:hypothetical protein